MKHLKLIVLREIVHFRGWFLLLFGWVALAILIHVLVLTIFPGVRLAEFLVVLKSYVVPFFFGILCALIGYADSPERGSHEFRTRPVRMKTLYLGKVAVIGGTAAALVLVQSIMNWIAGFPLGFWTLWWPLFLGGVALLSLGAIFKPRPLSVVQLIMVIVLPVLVARFVVPFALYQDRVEVFQVGIRVTILVICLYYLSVFLGKNFIRPKLYWLLVLPLTAVVAAGVGYLLSFDQQVVSVEKAKTISEERLRPSLRFSRRDSGKRNFTVSEPRSDLSILQYLHFSSQIVEFKNSEGGIHRIPIYPFQYHMLDSDEEEEILRALGITSRLSIEENKQRARYTATASGSHAIWRPIEIPSEMRGQDVEVVAEGRAHYSETQSLGTLPIREGASLENDDLSVEIIEVMRDSNQVVLRVHSRSGAFSQLGVYQKNLKQPYRAYGQTLALTSHDVTRGMSTVDIFKVGFHLEQIAESQVANVLHLFSTIYRGSIPFRSQSAILEAEEETFRGRPLRADFPVLPSTTPIPSK